VTETNQLQTIKLSTPHHKQQYTRRRKKEQDGMNIWSALIE